jgi:hypothetical protein
VDTRPCPINTIELANKKVLVRPKVASKGKGKNIIIGDPRTSNIHKEELLGNLRTKRLTSPEAAGGQAQSNSRAKVPALSITDYPAPTRGWYDAMQMVRPTKPNSPPWTEAPVLSHPDFGAPRPGREHNHQVCWDQVSHI